MMLGQSHTKLLNLQVQKILNCSLYLTNEKKKSRVPNYASNLYCKLE